MLHIVWPSNRDILVASMTVSVLTKGPILRLINISLCYHKLGLLSLLHIEFSFVIGRKRKVNFRSQRSWRHNCRLYNHVKDTQGHGVSCHVWPQCMISKGSHVKFARFVFLPSVKKHEWILEPLKNQSEFWKSPGNLFLKKGTNPAFCEKLWPKSWKCIFKPEVAVFQYMDRPTEAGKQHFYIFPTVNWLKSEFVYATLSLNWIGLRAVYGPSKKI